MIHGVIRINLWFTTPCCWCTIRCCRGSTGCNRRRCSYRWGRCCSHGWRRCLLGQGSKRNTLGTLWLWGFVSANIEFIPAGKLEKNVFCERPLLQTSKSSLKKYPPPEDKVKCPIQTKPLILICRSPSTVSTLSSTTAFPPPGNPLPPPGAKASKYPCELAFPIFPLLLLVANALRCAYIRGA